MRIGIVHRIDMARGLTTVWSGDYRRALIAIVGSCQIVIDRAH